METLLPCVELHPEGEARASVVWLHGLGADGHDFEPIVPLLGVDPALGVRFVFPHAPSRAVTINGGMKMPAWYDIRALSLQREVDEEGVRESARHVEALIGREVERGVPANRIVLIGFSQGGAMAFHVGLRYPDRLAAIVGLSTYLVLDDKVAAEAAEANRKTPIFQAHGELDPLVSLEAGTLSRDRLMELGYSVDWRTYGMGHEVHPQEIRDIGVFINEKLLGKGSELH